MRLFYLVRQGWTHSLRCNFSSWAGVTSALRESSSCHPGRFFCHPERFFCHPERFFCHPGRFFCHPGRFFCHPGLRAGIHAFECASRRLKHGPRIRCGVTTQVRFACHGSGPRLGGRGDKCASRVIRGVDPGSGAAVTVRGGLSPRPRCKSPQPRCMSPRPPSRDPCLQVRFARAKAWTPHQVRGDNASALRES